MVEYAAGTTAAELDQRYGIAKSRVLQLISAGDPDAPQANPALPAAPAGSYVRSIYALPAVEASS